MVDYSKHRKPRMGLSALFFESALGTRTFNTMMVLVGNDCDSIRMLLKLIHDPRIQFHPAIVEYDCDYTCPDNNRDMFYSQVMKVRPFVIGNEYDHMDDAKRRRLWKEYLERMAPDDAEMMEKFVKHKKSPDSRMSSGFTSKYFPEVMPTEGVDERHIDPMILLPATPWEGIGWASLGSEKREEYKAVAEAKKALDVPVVETVKKGPGRPKKVIDTTNQPVKKTRNRNPIKPKN